MIWPMFFMVVLTAIVGVITVRARILSVMNKEVKARYYKLMQGQEVPEFITKTGRNFNNQFEVPLLFYTAAILHLVLQTNSQFALVCAWAFVVSRYFHSFIHITYNHVLHRMLMFFAGFVFVLLQWIDLAMFV